MPTVACPHCGRPLSVSVSDLAANVRCPACRGVFCPLPSRQPAPVPAERVDEPEADEPYYPTEEAPRGYSFRCPFCRADYPPVVKKEITLAGWYLFVALLGSVCLAWLCWLPLVTLRREYRHCAACGIRLD